MILAAYAIIRRGERAPSVFVPVLALPVVVIGGLVGVIVTTILTAAAVLNEILPHR